MSTDRLWQIITLLLAANHDLLEGLVKYEPELQGNLVELRIWNRRIVQKARRMLEKEGVQDID
jgi:hypothetical protein